MLKTFFYGNHFYGLCAVLLSIETNVQLQLHHISAFWYLFAYSATTAYYTQAYLFETDLSVHNPRMQWYTENKKQLKFQQFLFVLVAFYAATALLWHYHTQLSQLTLPFWLLFLGICLLSLGYYLPSPTTKWVLLHPRSSGWFKPFIIGFVWVGMCQIAPIALHCVANQTPRSLTAFDWQFLLTSWLFISVLCILFDIKDYASDANKAIKTVVVRVGLRKTLFSIVLPLTLLSWGLFILYAILWQLSLMRIVCNSLPFVLLLVIAYSLHKRKSILYYLAIIDGLLLVKALCGIAGIILTTIK